MVSYDNNISPPIGNKTNGMRCFITESTLMKTNLGNDCVLMCALSCIVACFSLLMIVSKHLPKKLCPNGWMLDVVVMDVDMMES